jgi:ADP-heptose:LPS heptosyltransferase
MKPSPRIVISRTDSIGDVVLTLPVAGALKEKFPSAKLTFLGRDYTRDVVSLSKHIDDFLSWDECRKLDEKEQLGLFRSLKADVIIHVFPVQEIAKLAAKARIPERIGTSGRLYHYLYCNRLVRFSRRRSDLHEAQLNFKLLQPLIGDAVPSLQELVELYGLQTNKRPSEEADNLIDTDRFNLILHPKSKGSAREWPLENYTKLISLLSEKDFKIFISGTNEEGRLLKEFLQQNHKKVTDLTGRFSLDEFIDFINSADGLVAASTGPLHLSAALGKLAIGIYPPIRPMDPGRWAPLGKNAHFLVVDKTCNDCRKSMDCHCMAAVDPESVVKLIRKNAGKFKQS